MIPKVMRINQLYIGQSTEIFVETTSSLISNNYYAEVLYVTEIFTFAVFENIVSMRKQKHA